MTRRQHLAHLSVARADRLDGQAAGRLLQKPRYAKAAVIAWECGPYWVEDAGAGLYFVWVHAATHSVRVSTIHFPATPAMALGRACAEAIRRLCKDLETMTYEQTFTAYRY